MQTTQPRAESAKQLSTETKWKKTEAAKLPLTLRNVTIMFRPNDSLLPFPRREFLVGVSKTVRFTGGQIRPWEREAGRTSLLTFSTLTKARKEFPAMLLRIVSFQNFLFRPCYTASTFPAWKVETQIDRFMTRITFYSGGKYFLGRFSGSVTITYARLVTPLQLLGVNPTGVTPDLTSFGLSYTESAMWLIGIRQLATAVCGKPVWEFLAATFVGFLIATL